MFSRILNAIKTFFLIRKVKREFRVGNLVFQPETLMYFIVSGYDKKYCYLHDEYKMLTPVLIVDIPKYYLSAKNVLCPELNTILEVLHIDEQHGTIELEGRGFVTLQDLNEGNF